MTEEIPFYIQGAGGGSQTETARTPREDKEGVTGVATYIEQDDGTFVLQSNYTGRAVSLTEIRAVDLLCEGVIDGLVSGEYSYVGRLGNIGYDSATFVPYTSRILNGRTYPYLRSIYWNETPVVDKDNLFNFQQIDVQVTNGKPNGAQVDNINDELTISRGLNERLRGPNQLITKKTKKKQITAADLAAAAALNIPIDIYQNTIATYGAEALTSAEQFAKTYRILNKDCRGAIVNVKISSLSESITEGNRAGDVVKSSIFYNVYYKPIFGSPQAVTVENPGDAEQFGYILGKQENITGKISYGYIRSSRIDFQGDYTSFPDFLGWEIKILRITPDSANSKIRNQTYIDSLTEIYGEKFCYPNSAIVVQNFSAEYFSQIPNRAFDAKLLKVKIPSNYDPIKKTYDGVWDGTWKTNDDGDIQKEWTDNPAWCFYDLLTNKRYGLGRFIDENLIDKWTLYEISQYCDVLVSDGFGGLEPRFTCNLIINTREEAYKVVNDMASVFRAIVYYASGGIYSSQDKPKAPLFKFTNANVEDGNFNYSSTSKRVRHSVAVVRYNDKTDFYRPAVEFVEDVEAIKRYGVREVEVTAFGCTSRGQALRVGRWALLSESLETDIVSFTAGTEGIYLRPGDVIDVHDSYRKGFRHAGRTSDVQVFNNGIKLLLDDNITSIRSGGIYYFSILTPTFSYDPVSVSGLNSADSPDIRRSQIQKIPFYGGQVSEVSGKTFIDFTQNYFGETFDTNNYSLLNNMIWAIEPSGEGVNDPDYQDNKTSYRIFKIEENEPYKYVIAGVQYSEEKYAQIESGLRFESIVDDSAPSPVTNIALTNVILPGNNSVKAIKYNLVISPSAENISSFVLYAKNGAWVEDDFSESFQPDQTTRILDTTPDSRYIIQYLPSTLTSGYFIPLENGTYYFRAYSRNRSNIPSLVPAARSITVNSIEPFQNIRISALRLDGVEDDGLNISRTTGSYTVSEPVFNWQAGFITSTSDYTLSDLKYRITFRKSTDPSAVERATLAESPGGNDPYKPSSIIYHEVKDYEPTTFGLLSYKFDLETNIASFAQYYSNPTGVLREFDVVVESHLEDGTSSAGGNFNTDIRGGINDSLFSNNVGYDIIYVNNPKVPAFSLTSEEGYSACLISNQPGQICTSQYIDANGYINISVDKGSLPSDVAGGFVFSCPFPFTPAEALDGKLTANPNQTIYRSEFTNLDLPIIAQTNLGALKSGWVSIALYDQLDAAFRTAKRETISEYDIYSGLNLASPTVVINDGYVNDDPYRFHTWGIIEATIRTTQDGIDLSAGGSSYNSTLYGYERIEAVGEPRLTPPFRNAINPISAVKQTFRAYFKPEKYSINYYTSISGYNLSNTYYDFDVNLNFSTNGAKTRLVFFTLTNPDVRAVNIPADFNINNPQ